MKIPILNEHYGVAVDLQQRDRWAREVIQQLMEDPNEDYSYVCSGDSITFGYRTKGEGVVEIYDAKIIRTTIIMEDTNDKATA